MSNKTKLQANNTQLASLIQTLQGKAAGGGASVETCTVTLSDPEAVSAPYYYSYISLENGNIKANGVSNNTTRNVTLENVVCGSVVTVYWRSVAVIELSNLTQLTVDNRYFKAYRVDAPAGGNASATATL